MAIVFEDSPDVSHWDKGGLQGLKEAKERYGIDYTYIIREDAMRTLKTLGKQDFDIIISHDNLTWDNQARKMKAYFKQILSDNSISSPDIRTDKYRGSI